ncbi:sensor domain-containing diguanylate cyclase [Methylogaea oryzae]|nr:sensor domain-containing diguanylate cyclase [Methylogaea oryzae]
MRNQDMERCSLFLLQGERLVNVTGVDWDECAEPLGLEPAVRQAVSPLEFGVGEGVMGRAAQTRKLQHCRDCKNDDRFAAKGEAATGPGCLISAPILSGGELMGVLNISHPHANHFTEWHERLLDVYCALLALMLSNSRLLHQLEGAVHARTLELQQALDEARTLKQRFEALSFVDELTGLYNRRYLMPQAQTAFVRALRYREPLSVMLLDLDYFKSINDQHGHAAGDEVLSGFAAMLQRESREVDILGRMGGEEFAIVATVTDAEQVVKFAERLCQAARALTVGVDALRLCVTVSIGVAALDHDLAQREGWAFDNLLAQADRALYQAKREGRDRVVSSSFP